MDQLVVPQGAFSLARYPVRPKERLRAWDAADEYLLEQLAGAEGAPVDLSGSVLVVNDGSGAISVAIADHRPHLLSDSYLSHRAVASNLRENGFDPDAVTLLGSFDPVPERIDIVLVKIPKGLALLDDQLRRIAPHLHAGSVVIGAAMAKHVHTSTTDAFERFIGPTTTSLAHKKARLIFSTVDPDLELGSDPWPRTFPLAPDGPIVTSFANVFAADHLDLGTRFLLEHLPPIPAEARVVDLGCGNGILGLTAVQAEPSSHVSFVDESFAAIASARATVEANLGTAAAERTSCVVGNGLFDLREGPPIEPGSIDLVLDNPPFHQDNAVGDATAWEMFRDAHRALRPDGELWVVGNRHLAYHAKLTRLFGSCDVIAGSPKFVVLRAIRR